MPTPAPTIAIIDDDESIRRALRRFVTLLGFSVETFATAEEFLDSPFGARSQTEESFRCLILDVHLPGMSGLDLQEHLKAEGRDLAIVFITAYPNDRVRSKALQAGAIAFLHKPFDDQALVDAVNKGLATV
jgi:FixJ family two-component response regulator